MSFGFAKNCVLAATLIICGTMIVGVSLTSCKEDKNDYLLPSVQLTLEQRLVGIWYEEFEYKDMTESGKPFNRAMIAVEAKADHTGYVALAVFDDAFNEPLEVYGGPKDAPFT